jgi:hypothetical protein
VKPSHLAVVALLCTSLLAGALYFALRKPGPQPVVVERVAKEKLPLASAQREASAAARDLERVIARDEGGDAMVSSEIAGCEREDDVTVWCTIATRLTIATAGENYSCEEPIEVYLENGAVKLRYSTNEDDADCEVY